MWVSLSLAMTARIREGDVVRRTSVDCGHARLAWGLLGRVVDALWQSD